MKGERGQLEMNSQPVSSTQVAGLLAGRRHPASRTPDTALPKNRKTSADRETTWASCTLPTVRSQECAASFCLPDLTVSMTANSWILSKYYLPPITWQQATNRLRNHHLYLNFYFLEIKFLRALKVRRNPNLVT